MFAKQLGMQNYRKTLYQNYYSTHSGKSDKAVQLQHFNQQVRYFKREFKQQLPADKQITILDVGCGTGSLIQALNEMGYANTTGIDLSEEQVAMAHEFGVTSVAQADLHDFLASSNAKFDVIFAVDLIEHLTKDELVDFLTRLKDGLNDGGKVVFRTPNMDTPLASVFAFADFTHEVFLNKSSAMQIMQATGYTHVEVTEGIVFIENPVKELMRKLGWSMTKFCLKLQLFFTARTWDEVVFTPNIVISGKK